MTSDKTVPGHNPGDRPVRIHTLGRFQVLLAGAPIPFETRAQSKPLELLKVLIALGGENVSETLLTEAVWPDADGDLAHGAFTTTLYRLRKLIGNEALVFLDKRLTLNPDHCWVDGQAFAALLKEASRAIDAQDVAAAGSCLEQALALYQGPFLAGEFDPPEILSAREKLHGLFLRHLEELGRVLQDAGQFTEAVTLYRKGLETDDLAESFYRELMGCYGKMGRTAEGITVYRRCREILQASMNVEPSPETEAVYQALIAGGAEPAPQAQPPIQSPATPPDSRVRRVIWVRPRLVAAWLLAGVVVIAGATVGWNVYQARTEAAAVAAFEAGAAFPLPEQPSIAVLAFDNLSGDPAQEYFSDGLSESIITRLAGIEDITVIARTSTFTYKGKPVDVRRIGQELGVRYVLEGSVQKSGDRIRVNAQLIDAATRKHLWAKKFDRELQDIFTVQDEITRKVVTELEVKLTIGERARIRDQATDNVEALDLYLLADRELMKNTRESTARSRELFRKAIALDPKYALGIAGLGWSHMFDVLFRWSNNSARSLKRAEELATRSLAVKETSFAYALLSRIHGIKKNYDQAVEMGRRAVALEPNNSRTIGLFTLALVNAGKPEEGLVHIHKALRLQPFPTTVILLFAGHANYYAGRHAEAVPWYSKVIQRQQNSFFARLAWQNLIVSYMELGREKEARAEVEKLLNHNPDFTIRTAYKDHKNLAFKDYSFLDRHILLLRRAGLPE